MTENIQPFFTLLRHGIGESVSVPSLTPEQVEAVYAMAKRHDLAHLLKGLLPPGEAANNAKHQQYAALFRGEQMTHELAKLTAALEEAEIPFLPLKGSVLRQFYPQPWMRTSCDIDVLIHREDMERAIAYLTEKLGYQQSWLGSHDVTLISPTEVHIELHYTLVEEGRAGKASAVLEQVWMLSHPFSPDSSRWKMPPALFAFYHFAHMAKHIEEGGCGVRSFLDLWLLERQGQPEELDALLEEGGLVRFAQACRELVAYWFEDAEPTSSASRLGRYILDGGMYGTRTQQVAVRQTRRGSRFRYIWVTLFPSRKRLQYSFPVLQKHGWLLPGCWLWRIVRLPFGGRMHTAAGLLHKSLTVDRKMMNDTAALLEDIGL